MARWNEPISKEAFLPSADNITKSISGMPIPDMPKTPAAKPGIGSQLADLIGKGGRAIGGAGKGLAKKLWEADLGAPSTSKIEKGISGMPGTY